MFVLVLIVPFEFSDICEPFLVWFICCELSIQDVFRDELRVIRLPGASVVRIFDRRLDVSCSMSLFCLTLSPTSPRSHL